MVKYIIQLSLFLGIFLVIDKLFIPVINWSANAEVDKRLELIINGEMNKDIIVTGSSRGSRDVIAHRIGNRLGVSAYNLCYPGSDVVFHKFLIESLLKFNKPPKYILLVVDDNQELQYEGTVVFRKDRLYPLVKYPYIWSYLADIDDKPEWISRLLIINRLNKSNFDLRKKQFTPHDTLTSCGSMPISWHRDDWFYQFVDDDSYDIENEVDYKLKAFLEMINLIKSSGSHLVIVFPPNYKPHSPDFEKRIKYLAGEDVDYCVYDVKDSVYLMRDSYFDESHLMREEAERFTDEIINYIETIIKERD